MLIFSFRQQNRLLVLSVVAVAPLTAAAAAFGAPHLRAAARERLPL